MLYFILIVVLVIIIPILLDRVFPPSVPNLTNFFQPGDAFYVDAAGITNRIVRQEVDKVFGDIVFRPKAPGPEEHMHETTDEIGTVVKGTLTTRVNNKVSVHPPSSKIIIPKNVFHTMYNDTNEEIILAYTQPDEWIPVRFAYSKNYPYRIQP